MDFLAREDKSERLTLEDIAAWLRVWWFQGLGLGGGLGLPGPQKCVK